jgi:hypothetical protein
MNNGNISLPFDCWYIISRKLTYVDCQSLRMTCKNFYDLPQRDFSSIVSEKLQDYLPKDQIPRFLQILHLSKSYISGSFILDCLYDTNYHSNINIYTESTKEDTRQREEFTIPPCGKLTWSYGYSSNIFHEYLLELGYQPIQDEIYNDKCCTIKKYHKLGRFVHITAIPFKDIIRRSFDLDICKSTFDGKRLYIRSWGKLISRYDYILPIECFITTMSPIDPKKQEEITANRKKKYEERGFNIDNHPIAEKIKIEAQTHLMLNLYPLIYHAKSEFQDKLRYLKDGLINFDKYHQSRDKMTILSLR